MKLAALTLMAFCLFHQPLACQIASPTALWRAIKQELSGPHGREYFEKNFRDAELPPLYGTLVSSTPTDHPNQFLVAMADNPRPEVTLKLTGRLEKPLPAGTPVEFRGVGSAFTAEPFMLTFEVRTVDRATVPNGKDPTRNKNSK